MPDRAQFVAKPFREADLLKAVEAVIKSEIAPGPAVGLHHMGFRHAGQMHGALGPALRLSAPDE
jgi:hypothetical protein